jgi:hypothetical protein
MATTTPNFGWSVPTSTDLVKDGATAIETLGDSIDASLLDLKGGTSGQVLAKNSNTDMDFVWVAQDDSNAIQNAIVDAKGDLIAATADNTPARVAVGTNGQILTADSTAATGVAWATPAGGGGMTLLTTTTLSGTSTTSATFATTYKTLVCHFYGLNTSASNEIRLRVNSNTGNNYGMGYLSDSNTTFTTDNGVSSVRVVDYFATVPGYAVGEISIPQYANTSLTSKSCFVTQANTSARKMISIGYITETTAISSLTFFSTSTISGTVLIYGVN